MEKLGVTSFLLLLLLLLPISLLNLSGVLAIQITDPSSTLIVDAPEDFAFSSSVPLAEAIAPFQGELQAEVAKLEKKRQAQEFTRHQIPIAITLVNQVAEDTTQKVKKIMDELRAEIDHQEAKLITEIADWKDGALKELQLQREDLDFWIQGLGDTKRSVEKILEEGTEVEISLGRKRILSRIKTLLELKVDEQPWSQAKLSFQEDSHILKGIYEMLQQLRVERDGLLSLKSLPILNLDRINQPLLQFGSKGSELGQLHSPYGIAFNSKGHILVADAGNHRIQIFDRQGKYLSHFGSNGNGNGQLAYPNGLFFDRRTNKILVADTDNHRIQIFDEEGRSLKIFGSEGSDDGQFQHPYGICADEEGNILVSDFSNQRVQIFSSEGVFLRKIGNGQGSGPGELDCPIGIRVNSRGEVVVGEWDNHRISVFDQKGNFLRHLGVGKLESPYHLEIDGKDNIIVANYDGKSVEVFSREGEHLKSIGRGILGYPRGVCLIVDGSLAVSDGLNQVVLF